MVHRMYITAVMEACLEALKISFGVVVEDLVDLGWRFGGSQLGVLPIDFTVQFDVESSVVLPSRGPSEDGT